MGYNGVSNGKAVTWQGKESDGWVAVFIIPNMRSKISATRLAVKQGMSNPLLTVEILPIFLNTMLGFRENPMMATTG